MPPITDPVALANLVDLNRAVLEADAAIVAAASDHNEVASRRAALRRALAEHDANEPLETPDVADALSEALASNPSAASAPGWSDGLTDSAAALAEAHAAWLARRSVFAQAIARVEAEMVETEKAKARASTVRADEWNVFALAAKAALAVELLPRFEDLYRSTLGPLEGLGVGGGGVSGDSVLALGYVANGNFFHNRKLFPVADRSIALAALDDFRTRLANDPGKAAARPKAAAR